MARIRRPLRLIAALLTLALVLALVLAACGSTGTGGGSTTAPTTTPGSSSSTTSTPPGTSTSSATTVAASALTAAYRAETSTLATYQNVLRQFGTVRPFANIARSEQQHASTIAKLAAAHGVTLPGPAAGIASPSTLRLACALGVRSEQRVVALYDSYIPRLSALPALQGAFRTIRNASADQHLPAFQHCS